MRKREKNPIDVPLPVTVATAVQLTAASALGRLPA
jgi:hypothetical protein